MKLSICIPIYQCDVRSLVKGLLSQVDNNTASIEIVLLDDGSSDTFKEKNRELGTLHKVRYEELPENSGRSAVRNALAQMARGEYLLYLDSDSGAYRNDFIAVYLRYIEQGFSVIYGGRSYEPKPETGKELRWKFGVEREGKVAKFRQRDAYRYFLSNNFIISKSLIRQLKFDTQVKGYGYEDSVLAARLAQFEIYIKHIDNPVEHTVYETNDRYVDQTKNAIKNLSVLYLKNDPTTQTIAMLRLRVLIGPLGRMFKVLFSVLGDGLEKRFRKKGGSLWWFDLYRFSLLCSLS